MASDCHSLRLRIPMWVPSSPGPLASGLSRASGPSRNESRRKAGPRKGVEASGGRRCDKITTLGVWVSHWTGVGTSRSTGGIFPSSQKI
eukprot:5285736-Pyramimonas_sp.AAC.1